MSAVAANRLMVLGVIRRHGQAHGYRVSQELRSWGADEWASVGTGSIYHALRNLSKQGMLAAIEDSDAPEGPQRSIFQLTTAGHEEFLRLLRQAIRTADHRRDVLGAALAFMTALPRAEVIELFRERLESLRAEHRLIAPHSEDLKAWEEFGAGHVPELFRLWMHTATCEAEWADALIGRLTAGAYTMADDSPTAFGQPSSVS
jgi:DNA-binding PadR family transcriptional regulator